jgi:uncharacterized protein with PIN domain
MDKACVDTSVFLGILQQEDDIKRKAGTQGEMQYVLLVAEMEAVWVLEKATNTAKGAYRRSSRRSSTPLTLR